MTNNTIDPNLNNGIMHAAIGTMRNSASSSDRDSWYLAFSRAWGILLDAKAVEITELSDTIGAGDNSPGQLVQLTARSLEFGFLSNNAATSQNSIAEGQKHLASKQ